MKKKSTSLFLALLLWNIVSFGRQASDPFTKNYAGITAYSQHQQDVFAFTTNQAALSGQEQFAAGMYGERRFLLNELSVYGVQVAIPVSHGGFGVAVQHQGTTGFRQTTGGLAYGRQLGKKFALGAQFNYHLLALAGYGNASAITAELGALLRINDQLETGFQVSNPIGGNFGKTRMEKVPVVISSGIGYDVSEKVHMAMLLRKEEKKPLSAQGGVQYRLLPQVMVKAGCQTSPAVFWMGAGFYYKKFRVEVAGFYHLQLGVTPSLLLAFTGENKKRP